MKKKYDFYIKNISDDPKDPAYKAYIPAWNGVVMGANFKDLEEGIQMIAEFETKKSLQKTPPDLKKDLV